MKHIKTFFLKKFFLFIILISFNVFANDISDFEIEGISVGDSALDFFSNKDLKNAYDIHDYKTGEFRYYFLPYKNSKTYEYIQITVKTKDKNFKIYGLQGHIFYNNIEKCHNKMKSIKYDLDNLFNIKSIEDKGSHYIDPSGDSTYLRNIYYLDGDDVVEIVCYDMSKSLEEKGKTDRLAINLTKREFKDFINNNY